MHLKTQIPRIFSALLENGISVRQLGRLRAEISGQHLGEVGLVLEVRNLGLNRQHRGRARCGVAGLSFERVG